MNPDGILELVRAGELNIGEGHPCPSLVLGKCEDGHCCGCKFVAERIVAVIARHAA